MINILTQRLMKYSIRPGNHLASKLPLQRAHYFAFGANMNAKWLKQNNIFPTKSHVAYLQDFELHIDAPCEMAGKGYASVSPKPGARVYGIVYEISRYELAILDVLEWTFFKFYERHQAPVIIRDGETVDSWFYVALAPMNGLKASTFYKNILVSAATENSFPADYVAHLKDLPEAENFKLDYGFRLSNPSKRRWFEKQLMPLYRAHDNWREKICQYLP